MQPQSDKEQSLSSIKPIQEESFKNQPLPELVSDDEEHDDSHLPNIKGRGKPNLKAAEEALIKGHEEYLRLHPEEAPEKIDWKEFFEKFSGK